MRLAIKWPKAIASLAVLPATHRTVCYVPLSPNSAFRFLRDVVELHYLMVSQVDAIG